MSDNNQTHDRDASLCQLIDIEDDPIDRSLSDVRGLEDEVQKLRRTFLRSMTETDPPVRLPSLLVYGPAGTGKARFARTVASDLADHGFECAFLQVHDPRVGNPHEHVRNENQLVEIIDELQQSTPLTLLIEGLEEVQLRDNGAFHRRLDQLRRENTQLAIIGVLTSSRRRVSPRHCPEYFSFADVSVHLDEPDRERRAHLLTTAIERLIADDATTLTAGFEPELEHSIDQFEIERLEDIARRTVQIAHSRSENQTIVSPEDVSQTIDQLATERPDTGHDQSISDSENDEFQPTVPDVTFDEIGGLDSVIRRLRELLTYPQRYDDLYSEALSPTAGVLLHGPPGTGKTLLAKALATETDRSFYAVEGAAVKSMWFGQSEQRVRDLFDAVRDDAPSILFFDELDALAGERSTASHSTVQSIVNTLLAELDGVKDNDELFVVAATNRPEAIDPAIKRPGRIGESIEVPPPDQAGQREIFRLHTRQLPTAPDVTGEWFAGIVPDGITGADITAVVERAVHYGIRTADDESTPPEISRSHVRLAVDAHLDRSETERRGFE